MNATAELLTIGDEILFGHITDTNSQWMASVLSDAGVAVIRTTTVGDIREDILAAFVEAERRADIVLITGGLGPTQDDLTKSCLARHFGCELRLHEEALADVTAFFARRGRELTELNRLQAMLPACCEKITNAIGTAPGMWFERGGKIFVSMPGVPREMKLMMTEQILPRLYDHFHPTAIVHHLIKTVGIGESFLAERIEAWENSLPAHIRLAYLPGYGEVKLRLTAQGEPDILLREIRELAEALKPYAGEFIYGHNEDTLESVVGNLLADRQLTIAFAESCTGGYLSHQLTSVPGSSAYFKGSIIAYANEIKIIELGVDTHALATEGAVSESVVRQMAEGVKKRLNTHIGVATTGVAGPTGGTPEKPVGTVWIACAYGNNTIARQLKLSEERMTNIRLTSTHALNLVRRILLNQINTD